MMKQIVLHKIFLPERVSSFRKIWIPLLPKLSDFHYKTSRTGVFRQRRILKGEMTGQPGRLSYRGLGALANKNRSIWVLVIFAFLALLRSEFAFSSQTSFSANRRDKLFSVRFINDKVGFVVGNKGLLLHTTNGGESWEKVEVNANSMDSLNDIGFIDKYGWIVGGSGLILHSKDSGQNWTKQLSNTESSLMAVNFINRSEGFIVGEGGEVLVTGNGGESWRIYPLDWMSILPQSVIQMGVLAPNLYDIFFQDNRRGWIVGEKGLILSTSDGGKEWELLSMGIYPSLYSIHFKDQFEGFVAGQEGSLLYTQDGGKSWDQLKLPAEVGRRDLFKIAMEGSFGVVVGDRGLVLKSLDEGRSWEQVALDLRPPLPWFLGVTIIPRNSPGKVILAGQGIVTCFLIKEGENRPW